MRIAAIVTAALACACPSIDQIPVPPSPPSWAEGCSVSNSFYIDEAYSEQDLLPLYDIPSDPQEALDLCTKRIEDLGFEIVEKGADPETQWGQFTTTLGLSQIWDALPDQIQVGRSFKNRPVESQATTMCHELVHAESQVRLGIHFFTRYGLNEGTFAYETMAYRQSINVKSRLNPDMTFEKKEELANNYLKSLRTKYRVTRMPEECLFSIGSDILLKDQKQ